MRDSWVPVAALADRSRRILYDFVRHAGRAISREDAAEATGMSRGLAAFHLDKLVEAGLLAASYEAPPDQPRGRGRTPKVYVTVGDGLAITIPERRYELIARILADAVAEHSGDAAGAAARHARERGRALGEQLPRTVGLIQTLESLGYEPAQEAGSVRLRNCPFHALADSHTELVCGLNHAFVAGLVAGADPTRQARLAPRPGSCCVEIAAGQRSNTAAKPRDHDRGV